MVRSAKKYGLTALTILTVLNASGCSGVQLKTTEAGTGSVPL